MIPQSRQEEFNSTEETDILKHIDFLNTHTHKERCINVYAYLIKLFSVFYMKILIFNKRIIRKEQKYRLTCA